MPKRYQKMQGLLPEIKKMLESGMSQREVAESLGLEGDRPIRKWVTDISYIPTKGFLYCPHNLGQLNCPGVLLHLMQAAHYSMKAFPHLPFPGHGKYKTAPNLSLIHI